MGGLRLDTREGLFKGGTRGAAVVAGDPERSLLMRAISHQDPELQMPPTARLTDDEISALSRVAGRSSRQISGTVLPSTALPETVFSGIPSIARVHLP